MEDSRLHGGLLSHRQPPLIAAAADHLTMGLRSWGLKLKWWMLLPPSPGGREPVTVGIPGTTPRRWLSPRFLDPPGRGGQARGT